MATLILDAESTDPRFIHLDNQSTLIGKGSDADVSIQDDSLADHHARIEHKEDGYYIINLHSESETFVNGGAVTFQKMKHGDRLKIGDVSAVVMLEEDDEPEYETPIPETPNPAMMPVARGADFSLQSTTQPCPQCGFSVSANMMMCPQCGHALSNNAIMHPGYVQPIPMNLAGPGILPVIAFLAALSVIGAPIALVLGLITLSVIRRNGGTVRDHRMAKWSIGLGLFWAMAGLLVAGGFAQKARERKLLDTHEVYEAEVIRALKSLACAQKYARTIEYFDADGDGQGEYGNLSALVEMNSPFFNPDLADGEAFGYRFTVREASEGRFLAVAEPAHYKRTGIRTFAIDRSGQIRGGDAAGRRFAQIGAPLPVLQGERSAYYEVDDEIAKDVLNYTKSLSSTLTDQEKTQRILSRLRSEYSLTTVGRELEGMKATVDRFVTEQRAQKIYLEAKAALADDNQDVALAKLVEISEEHPSFSKIAAVERELIDLRSTIEQQREVAAQDLFAKAEELERSGESPEEVQRLFQRIEKFYPDTEVAERIASLKPELKRQMRERGAEEIFSELMELSPEHEYDQILSQANQLRRSYSDTDLFKKIKTELAKKERSARASSWRFKTRQNIEAGRMRGALAQLEAAIRENPDLQYDLRDLSAQLYRDVADKMVEEGDARGALGYYTQLNRLLQAAGSEELVSRELLAKLNLDVGMADYERKDYAQARRHFASAAWKYQDDAQFNMRSGSANLHLGLYQPAETALTRALDVRPDMTSALLYRAYLNMRVVLELEQVIAGKFKQELLVEAEEEEKVEKPRPAPSTVIVAIEDELNEDNDIIINAGDIEGSSSIAAPDRIGLRSSSAGTDWFSQFAENETGQVSSVPGPADLDLFLSFDYPSSSRISTVVMKFLQDLNLQQLEKDLAENSGRAQAGNRSSPNARMLARKMARMELEVSEQKNSIIFNDQLKQLRTLHLEDTYARDELYDMMKKMKESVHTAISDIQAVGGSQPHIRSLTENVLQLINTKYEFLLKAETLIIDRMKEEVDLREKMLKLAERMVQKDAFASATASSFDRSVGRFRSKLLEDDGTVEIGQALLNLRSSMDVRVNLNDILHSAEGNTQAPAGQ